MENQDPPLLRVGTSTQNCGSCINFYLLQRSYPSDDGRCSLFRTFIRSDFVCDAFYSIYADNHQGDSPDEKPGPSKSVDKDITGNKTVETDEPEQIW